MARPRVAAGALFLDDSGRVLLVHPVYEAHWDIPGGYVEPGESPPRACRREVHEELAITPTVGALLAVDWAPVDDEGDKLLFNLRRRHHRPVQDPSVSARLTCLTAARVTACRL